MNSRLSLGCVRVLRAFPRYYSEGADSKGSASGSIISSETFNVNVDVPGLSSSVVKPAQEPVGPGVDPKKSGAYKVPEYYCYNDMSFFEAEIEMMKYRIPQPSAVKDK